MATVALLNSKKENLKIMKYLGISKEDGKELFALTKAFKTQDKAAQERICQKYELPQGRTYGCWKYSHSFGEFLAKVFGKGEFLELVRINSVSTFGVFKKSPVFDPIKGWVFQSYLQIRDERGETPKYIPITEVLEQLQVNDRELPEELVEYLESEVSDEGYVPMDGPALDLLVLAKINGVLPNLSESLQEVLTNLWSGGFTTPPSMGDERYDNALEPEVWQRDEDADLERDLFSPSMKKVLRSLSYLESSSLPKAKELKSLYWNKEGLNIKLLWRDLQQKGYAETLTWEGWDEDPDKGSYEEKTLWSLKALRSLTKEELQTLLEMKEDTLLKNMGYSSLQANPCKVYHVDPKTLQGGRKHEVKSHVHIPWKKNDLSKS